MDAFVSPMLAEVLSIYRPGMEWKQYTQTLRSDFTYNFTNLNELTYQFDQALTLGKKVVFGDLKVADTFNKLSVDKSRKTEYIWSECSQKDKRDIIVDEERLKTCHTFIYSPVFTVGVSIEGEIEFDVGFFYFQNNCNDANSCCQMTARVRSIKEKTLWISVKSSPYPNTKLCEDDKAIDNILSRREKLYKMNWMQKHSELKSKRDNDMNEVFKHDEWYHVIRAIIKNKSKSINNFLELIINYMGMTGGKIHNLLKKNTNKVGMDLVIMDTGEMVKKARYELFMNTPLITEVEYNNLINSDRSSQNTEEDKQKIKKYQLLKIYFEKGMEAIPPLTQKIYEELEKKQIHYV